MFFSLLMVSAALAADGVTVVRVEEEPRPALERRYDLKLDLELRAEEDLRDSRPETKSRQSLHELSVGGRYKLERDLAVEAEFSVEEIERESRVLVKQAFVDWMPIASYGRLRLGQQFLPVGLLNERDNLFSSVPPFMQRLLTEQKSIDLGARLTLRPLGHEWIYAEGSLFAGRQVRPEDERIGSPETAPRILSARSDSAWHSLFASYFEHDYAFYDPIRAYGAGFELRSPEDWPLRLGLLGEYWDFREIQNAGPDQRTRAGLGLLHAGWWRLGAGYRYSRARSDLLSASGAQALPTETSELYFVEIHLTKFLRLRGERVYEVQGEVLTDERVARALVNWEL